MEITTPINVVKGVGAKTEQLFQKTGVYTIGDILLRFPREYTKFPIPVEISKAAVGHKQAVIVRVDAPVIVKRTRSMQIAILTAMHQNLLENESGKLHNCILPIQMFFLFPQANNLEVTFLHPKPGAASFYTGC